MSAMEDLRVWEEMARQMRKTRRLLLASAIFNTLALVLNIVCLWRIMR